MSELTRIRMARERAQSPNSPPMSGLRDHPRRAMVVCLCLLLASTADSQTKTNDSAAQGTMGEHYEAAQKALIAKDVFHAETEYQSFIVEALRRLANRRAAAGDLAKSVVLLEEALDLTPDDINLRLEYAG